MLATLQSLIKLLYQAEEKNKCTPNVKLALQTHQQQAVAPQLSIRNQIIKIHVLKNSSHSNLQLKVQVKECARFQLSGQGF